MKGRFVSNRGDKLLHSIRRRTPLGLRGIESVRDDFALTRAEDRGVARALDQLDTGQGRSLAAVVEWLTS